MVFPTNYWTANPSLLPDSRRAELEMNAKGIANQGANSNTEMPATTVSANVEQISNISSNEVAADKTTIVNQSAPKAPLSPDQQHSHMNNVGVSNQLNHHHHHHHHHQQHQQHHHQQRQSQHQPHHHHHHQHVDHSNSDPAAFVHHDDARYGPYQNQHNAPYYHQNRPRRLHKNDNESPVNYVILITVINPHYPITCDLIHQICSTYGKVIRIVIFKKNGVQAMVEFDGIEPAKRAKAMLHGCDIYSGCCTLRVEFAKPARLNVHKNDSESFDYTNLELGSNPGHGPSEHISHQQRHQQHHQQQPAAPPTPAHQQSETSHVNHTYLPNHGRNVGPNRRDNLKASIPSASIGPVGGGAQVSGGYHADQSAAASNHDLVNGPNYVAVGEFLSTSHCIDHNVSHYNMIERNDQHPHHHQPHPHHNQHHRDALMSGGQGTVMMVYGLNPDRINCDRLFNLFCLYGNVVKIKFLKTKEGCAMVQMGDVIAVDRCVSSLNKITLFGSELQISYSKQPFLHDVIQPFALPDKTPSFKDFMSCKNNRFKNPEVASKNRILPPSKVLHFFNAPYGISEDELVHLFKQATEGEPMSIQIFTPKADNVKSYSGLVTFRDPAEATEALVLCNHIMIPKAGAPHPYILRLCFSPPTYC